MDSINISVIGTGYVGAVTGTCLAEMGNRVTFVGRNREKLDLLGSGKTPIYEPGLEELLTTNKERIKTTTDLSSAIKETDITFVCVGTPSRDDGSIDLQQINDVSVTIGKSLAENEKYHTIIVKSTVLPGTTEEFIIPILERESGKKAFIDFGIASNPEFLKEGSAVDDFFHTDRVVIGVNDKKTENVLKNL